MNQLDIQIIIEITTKRKQTNLIALLGCAAARVVDDDVATETETAMRKKIDFHVIVFVYQLIIEIKLHSSNVCLNYTLNSKKIEKYSI